MAANIDILIDAQQQADQAIRQVIGSLDDLDKSASNTLTRGLKPLQDMMMTGLKAAAATAAAAIGGLAVGIGKSIGAAEDMEQRIADIGALMGTSAEETDKLKNLITDLGLDPTLKVSATEAADAIQTLGTAGVSVQEILDGAAKSTVLLSNATGADFGQSAAIATDAMAQFGFGAEDMKGAIDSIVATTINSKFDIQDYQYALGNAGGAASAAGVEFDDFNATIAAISPFFKEGANAGTSFKVFLSRLVPGTNSASDAMRELGLFSGLSADEFAKVQGQINNVQNKILTLDPASKNYTERLAKLNGQLYTLRDSLKEGQSAFFDTEGNMKSMAEIAGVLNEKMSGLSEYDKTRILHDIFGEDAKIAATALAEYTEEQFKALQATMATTDAQEAAAKRMDTFKGAVEILQGVVETISLGIGDKFLPALTDLTQRFTTFLGSVGPQIIEWAGALATDLEALANYIIALVTDGDAMNDWLTHMSPPLQNAVLWTVNMVNSLQDMLQNVRDFLRPITDLVASYVSWKDIMVALGAVFASVAIPALASLAAAFAPVVLVAGTLVLAISTLRNAWESNFGGIQEKTQAVWAYLNERFGLIFTAIKTLSTGALAEIAAWVSGTETKFTNLKGIWDTVKLSISLFFQDILKYVTDNLPAWIDKLASWGAALLGWVVGAIPGIAAKLGEWASALFTWFAANLPAWVEKLAPWGMKLAEWISTAIPKAIEALTQWIDSLFSWGDTTGSSRVTEMLTKLGTAMLTALGKVGLSLGALALTIAADLILKLAEGLLNWMGIEVNFTQLHDFVVGLIDTLKNTLTGAAAAIGGLILASIMPGLSGIVGAIWSMAIPAFGALLAAIAPIAVPLGLLAAAIGAVYLAWKNDFLGIRELVWGAFEYIKGIFTNFPQTIEGVKNTLYEWGTAAMTRLKEGIEWGKGMVQSAFETVKGWIMEFPNTLGNIRDTLWQYGADAMTKLREGLLSGQNTVRNAIDVVVDFMQAGRDQRLPPFQQSLYDAGAMVMSKLGQGFSATKQAATDEFKRVMDDVQNQGAAFAAGAFAGRMYESARGAILRFAEGLKSASPNLSNDMLSVLNAITSTFNGSMDGFKNHAFSVMQAVGGRIGEGLASIDAGSALDHALWSIIDGFNGIMDGFKIHVWDVMKNIGSRITGGLSEGIRTSFQAVLDALNWIAAWAPQWVKDKLGISSPSKVFEGIGQNIMAGLAEGINQMVMAPQAAIAEGTASLVGATSNVVNNRQVTNNYNVSLQGTGAGGFNLIDDARYLGALYGGS